MVNYNLGIIGLQQKSKEVTNVNNFIYLVFNETGLKVSKELKSFNKNCKIIHFSNNDDLLEKSIADIKMNFALPRDLVIETFYNECLLKAKRVSSLLESMIKKEKRIIVINDFFDLQTDYLYEYVVEVLIKNKKEFKTVSCSPFWYMRTKRKKAFEKANKKLPTNNNLYFDCDDLIDEKNKFSVIEQMEVAQKKLAKIAIE